MHPLPRAAAPFVEASAVNTHVCVCVCVSCGAAVCATWLSPLFSLHTTWCRHVESRKRAECETNFPELSCIRKIKFISVVGWLAWVDDVDGGEHKSERQASLWRRASWYLRWWLDRQTIMPSIRVSFPLQHLMAWSQRSISGCHSCHYPTRSCVINDKPLEYWFNLQSGAIRRKLQTSDNNLWETCFRWDLLQILMLRACTAVFVQL